MNISLQFNKASYLRLLGLRFSRRSRRRIDQGWADCFDPLNLDQSLIALLGGFHNVLRYHFCLPYHYHSLTTSERNNKVIQKLKWSRFLFFQLKIILFNSYTNFKFYKAQVKEASYEVQNYYW